MQLGPEQDRWLVWPHYAARMNKKEWTPVSVLLFPLLSLVDQNKELSETTTGNGREGVKNQDISILVKI